MTTDSWGFSGKEIKTVIKRLLEQIIFQELDWIQLQERQLVSSSLSLLIHHPDHPNNVYQLVADPNN